MSLKDYVERTSLEDFDAGATPEQPVVPPASEATPQVPATFEEIYSQDSAFAVEGKVLELDKLTEVEASIEAYIGILRKTGDHGIDRTAAAALAVGLQTVAKVVGPVEIPSNEAFGGTMSRRDATQISMEALEINLKEAGKKIAATIQQLIEMIVQFTQDLFQDTERLNEKVQDLLEQTKSLSGISAKVSFANTASVSDSEGMFLGHDIKPVAGLVDFLEKRYLATAKHLIEIAVRPEPSFETDVSSALAQADLDTVANVKFPGGLSLTPKEGDFAGLKISIEPKGEAGEFEVEVSEILRRATALSHAIEAFGRFTVDYKHLKGPLETLKDKLSKEEAGEHDKTIREIVKFGGEDLVNVSRHCYRTLVAYVGVLAHEIKALQAEGQDEAA